MRAIVLARGLSAATDTTSANSAKASASTGSATSALPVTMIAPIEDCHVELTVPRRLKDHYDNLGIFPASFGGPGQRRGYAHHGNPATVGNCLCGGHPHSQSGEGSRADRDCDAVEVGFPHCFSRQDGQNLVG